MRIDRLHASGVLSGPYRRRQRRMPDLMSASWAMVGIGLLILLFAR